jgi:hypothetical protein
MGPCFGWIVLQRHASERASNLLPGNRVRLGGRTQGSTGGADGQAGLFAGAREGEKGLAGEVLDKYRELHLLYRLSEKLIARKPDVIGQVALNEVCTAHNLTWFGLIATYDEKPRSSPPAGVTVASNRKRSIRTN